MGKGTLKIHSQNILPIIKKWLYSEKDIFVRELVSNACDAIYKLTRLRDNQEVTLPNETPLEIRISIDKEQRKITFSDNGIGMDAEEVEKYIAQIAFSGAEEFVKKYESKKEEDQVIGHFGLGFYSSYMVAKHVEIHTLSFKESAEAVYWSCDGSSEYLIEMGKRETRGTDIILNLADDEDEYLDHAKLKQILSHYCAFLPYAIYLDNARINEKEPLWLKAPAECSDKDYLDFYRVLFPMQPDPLFWVHLNVDFPFHLKGILYFPKISNDGDLKKESIHLFCNRVFVSDSCKDLLPDYLMVLRGAIDSPDIPLNVSRSYLQMDKTVRQLGTHISKKISDRLASLYRSDREKFLSYWEDIEPIIKFGILQDDKFYERAKEFLVWKNQSAEWTTVEEYLERNGKENIYYVPEERLQSHFCELYKEKGIEILTMRSSLIDQALIQFLERKVDAKFKRIDSNIDDALLDPSKEKSILDADGKSEAAKIADFFRSNLGIDHLEVEAKSLASTSMPAFLMIKEEERRFRDSMAYQNKGMLKHAHAFVKPTFVINTNNKLINAIHGVSKIDPQLAKKMTVEIYDLARLSQNEMEPDSLSSFITRSTEILENLLEHVSKK